MKLATGVSFRYIPAPTHRMTENSKRSLKVHLLPASIQPSQTAKSNCTWHGNVLWGGAAGFAYGNRRETHWDRSLEHTNEKIDLTLGTIGLPSSCFSFFLMRAWAIDSRSAYGGECAETRLRVSPAS